MLVSSVTSVRIAIAPCAGEMRGLFTGGCVDLGDRDARTLAGEQDCRRTANAGAGAGDECHLAFEPSHAFPPRARQL